MKNPPMTLEDFKRHINAIKKFSNLQDAISNAIIVYNGKSEDAAEIFLPSLECTVVELLEKIFNDECNWISYWVYELNFGKLYKDGCITMDNKIVKLKTVEDLWNLLIED